MEKKREVRIRERAWRSSEQEGGTEGQHEEHWRRTTSIEETVEGDARESNDRTPEAGEKQN